MQKAASQTDHKTRALNLAKAIGAWTPADGKPALANANSSLAYELALYIGDPRTALTYANAAINLDPDSAGSFNTRGFAYQRLHRYEKALRDFRRAVALDKDGALAGVTNGNLCLTFHLLSRDAQALPACGVAIDAATDADVKGLNYLNRASVYASLGRYREAFEDCDKGRNVANLQGASTESAVTICQAYAYDKSRETARAVSMYDSVLNGRDPLPIVYFLRGEARRSVGNLGAALLDYDKAISLDDEYVEAYSARGQLRLKAGDFKGAKSDFQQACRREWSPACSDLKRLKSSSR